MGRTVIAYHGTGHWHSIRETGILDPSPESVSHLEGEGAFVTCGGTHLTASPEIAIAQALQASTEIGGDPTVVMVEIDERLLIPDDGNVGIFLHRFLDENVPHWNLLDSVSVAWAIRGVPAERIAELAATLGGSASDADHSLLVQGLTSYACRMIDDWNTNLGVAATVINDLCKAYRTPVEKGWSTVVDGDTIEFVGSFRTLESIGDAPGAKIVGAATLVFEDAGMTLAEVVTEGQFPREEADRIAQAALDRLVDEGHDVIASPYMNVSGCLVF